MDLEFESKLCGCKASALNHCPILPLLLTTQQRENDVLYNSGRTQEGGCDHRHKGSSSELPLQLTQMRTPSKPTIPQSSQRQEFSACLLSLLGQGGGGW